MIPKGFGRLFRAARWRLSRWSSQQDQTFHDHLFEGISHDAFSRSYPGYISTRRFADLVSPYVSRAARCIDFGCGPGEITCELAKRFPSISFLGIDHSKTAIERAQGNAKELGCENVTFAIATESFEPASNVDLVLLFDAFHHLSDPIRWVQRMANQVSRFVLIEPHGGWEGSWRKDLDFDWLLLELDKLRARVAYLTGEQEQPGHSNPPAALEGEPVEHRYTLDDYQRFFNDFSLEVHGTISGLDAYPPDPYSKSAARERFNDVTYQLMSEIDQTLRERQLDLHAKHWVIYAEKGGSRPAVRLPNPVLPPPWAGPHAQGSHDMQYLHHESPAQTIPGGTFVMMARIKNLSWRLWRSDQEDHPFFLSYHWESSKGATVVMDGKRTPLPRPLGPGEELDVAINVTAPDKEGSYTLMLDMVQEGVAWFTQSGVPPLRIPIRIKRQT